VIVGVACFALGAAMQRLFDTYARPRDREVALPAAPAAPPPAVTMPASVPAPRFEHEPLWAYGFTAPPMPGEKAQPQALPSRALRPNQDADEQTRLRRVDGSTAQYSLVDIRDLQNVVDWFPDDHPPMPDIIKHGPASMGPARRGCGSCHLPNGKGRPENAAPAGLPVAYALRQLHDFRSGLRYTADPRKPNTNTMIELAKGMTEDEMRTAAEYFAAIKWTPRVEVRETTHVPKTRIVGNLFLPLEKERSEPIGARLIEVPVDEEQTETLRNPRVGFIAYVPPGTLARGKDLVLMGGMTVVNNQIVQGKTTACTTCHGLDLMGVADVPPIAGRSPSYMARQLWDMQQGTRNGASAQLMKLVVANLTPDDMLAIAAYVASVPPPSAAAAPVLTQN
jgi:cytochrome c553